MEQRKLEEERLNKEALEVEEEMRAASYSASEMREMQERRESLPSSALEADWKGAKAAGKGMAKKEGEEVEAEVERKRKEHEKKKKHNEWLVWKPKKDQPQEGIAEHKELERGAASLINTTLRRHCTQKT